MREKEKSKREKGKESRTSTRMSRCKKGKEDLGARKREQERRHRKEGK